ncbi:MAG TPA: hypothetical protein VHN37_02680 [Actinomycetota bacterium]|nr:hypothetical protein [Actinomycetota bacterium]
MGADDAQAGVFVSGRGAIRAGAASGAGGLVGAAIATGSKGQGSAIDLGDEFGYLAVMPDDDIVLFRTKRSLMSMKPKLLDETWAEAPLSAVTRSAFTKGKLVSVFEIEFADGSNWQFDVARNNRKDGEAVAQRLGATIE